MAYNAPPVHMPIGRSASPSPYAYAAPIARPVSRGPSPAPQAYGGPAPYSTPAAYGNPAPYGGRPVSRGPSPAPGYGGGPGVYAAPIPQRHPISRGPSPAPGAGARSPNIEYQRQGTATGFQVEKRAKSPNPYGRPPPDAGPTDQYRDEAVYREQVSTLIAAKDSQFAATGHIPVDPAQLVLFFRVKTGITHSLDFPIDISYSVPPAFDVLIAACRPNQRADYDSYGNRDGLFYPPNLPLTASLDIANSPILDAIRGSLFPLLPVGEYLTAVRDGLDVVQTGSHIGPYSPSLLRNDQRAGTIIVTLPTRFRGGAMHVRDPDGREEKFQTTGGRAGDIEWVAFRSDCEYEVEPVTKGCLITLSYAIYIRSFGPATGSLDTLITPTDTFFDLLSPILNMSRGRSIAFYLTHDYNVNPAEATANSVVPLLKGSDALLYNAFKLHKLAPDLQWTAGGYVWAKEQSLEFFGDDDGAVPAHSTNPLKNPRGVHSPFGSPNVGRGAPPVRGAFQYPGQPLQQGNAEEEIILSRVRASGAIPLIDANITLLTDYRNPNPAVGKERVFFVANDELQKLVLNMLLVVYIP